MIVYLDYFNRVVMVLRILTTILLLGFINQFIWVNYYSSLTWNVGPFGMISLSNHHLWWGRNEVAIIYPDIIHIWFRCHINHKPYLLDLYHYPTYVWHWINDTSYILEFIASQISSEQPLMSVWFRPTMLKDQIQQICNVFFD